MSVYSGDFLGFQLGNVHSSQLNITRVSNNNRYTENLTPDITDGTAVVPGGDGTYYWRTTYPKKPFIIDFAFDDLRDEDIRRLRQTLSFKGVQKLIFDEAPYKYYLVKCNIAPSLKYIAFQHHEVTVYKGEGSISLVAYYPYGISTNTVTIQNKTNSKLLNPGDLPAALKIYYSLQTAAGLSKIQLLEKQDANENIGELNFSSITQLNENDQYICIDMKNHLIEGLNENMEKTGTLYNRFISSGDFFSLPVGIYYIDSNVEFEKIEFSSLYY